MNYTETVEWMFNRLPMFQQVGASAYKKDLTNTLALANHLGNPEKQLRCIHVAGTNGKGSTSHLLASVLQEAGYKVGLYTSPHLKDYRERIKINGTMIPESFVVDFVAQHKIFLEAQELSFFEMTVGLAFDYFAKEQTDINIIEVGMGGRLDSTNIITPLLSVITNIGLDHTQFLGDTLEAIAGEKAGIIKASIPVIIGEYTHETRTVFETKAAQTQSAIYLASDIQTQTYPSALKGAYQEANKKTVQQALTVLKSVSNFDITESQIQAGFENVVANTGLLGRWQVMGDQPKIIADTAHNEHGLRIVLQQLMEEPKLRLHIVLGVVNDKDLTKILPLFPKDALYYFCKPNIPRGLDASVLGQLASDFGLMGMVCDSVSNAYQKAREQARPDDVIYVGGSTFVVAELF
ncbi:bifunctional folylpolyglutamate synthase/dihydrofolate synthase [Flavobacterium stagni]|uniref:Dihydrofolate synthase/folylpolyglutamate synthase n=1 Tax=Flavobacterium stagni TaxID=2506421 RepID=A0A4Q1K844_9FLAO|nr:folylpolyglutamate synthase/dihydrofolate synthase family protein [Flavobacterium stagni]RXR22018.1 bifunctional folylpolyglutamate synthase/dihydrofolate synthase [Flavobacterium stagni]